MEATLETLILSELMIDGVPNDVTAGLLSTGQATVIARISTRQPGVFSGAGVVDTFASIFKGKARIERKVPEGKTIEPGEVLVELESTPSLILSIERTLLNFLSVLCGTASITRRFVEKVGNRPTKILATRKTIPGLRDLQLAAVKAGGGFVHRRSLSDGILIKENHQEFAKPSELIERARRTKSPLHRIEIEVQSIADLKEVLKDPPDVVMLDNFDKASLEEAMKLVQGKCEIEVSGGITMDRVGEIAALGVNYISVGALTHSAPGLNLTLDFIKGK